MAVAETETVVRAWVDACNRSDVEAALALVDPGIAMREPELLPGSVDAVGIDAVRHYLERFDVHWSSFAWEPLELIVDGDRALMPARLRLTGRESGIEVDRTWFYVFVVRDGKLMSQVGHADRAGAEQAFHGSG